MKRIIYALIAATTALTLTTQPTQAAAHHPHIDSPAEIQRKAAAREKVATAKKTGLFKHGSRHKFNMTKKMSHAMRVVLGLEESKAVTSPAKRNRQLHAHQRQLRVRTRLASPSRRHH